MIFCEFLLFARLVWRQQILLAYRWCGAPGRRCRVRDAVTELRKTIVVNLVMERQRPWLQRMVYDSSRIGVRVFGRLFFGLCFLGSENFPSQGAALVCSNHQSFLDPLLVGAMCDRRLNYLARENLFRSRLFGALIRYYDAIPVRRDGMSLAGLKETLRRLRRQEMVVIFPEGTRTDNGEIKPLKAGFCVLARKQRIPIVPVAIAGAYEVWPKGAKLPCLARVCLAAGKPITSEQVAALDDKQLVALLDERIRECFHQASQKNGNGRHRWSSAA